MVVAINSNKDMPAYLDTARKQKRVARGIAETHFKKPVKSVNGPQIQGCFSRTVFVTFEDGSEVVLQFRPEPLDMTPFRTARQVLGSVVPEIEQIHSKDLADGSITIYHMTKMHGSIWWRAVAGKKAAALPIINRSIGEIFAHGYVRDGTSAIVVEERLRPHLEKIVDSEQSHITPFQAKAKDLLNQLTRLHDLPLWITHFDLDEMNILLNEDFRVSGLIDWELSFPQPFGLFLARIHTLAGEFSEGKFVERAEFETSERALWTALYEGLAVAQSQTVCKAIFDNPELVQLAIEVGTLLDAFQLDEGELLEEYDKVVVRSLPKFFSYRIPALRGDACPYSQ